MCNNTEQNDKMLRKSFMNSKRAATFQNLQEKAAFTLAEVLITLGIIGVIAALTIPTLMSAYNKKTVETRLARLYSMMNQAIKLSTIDNGDTPSWRTLGTSSNSTATYEDILDWYNEYLAKYLKVQKVEQMENSQDLLVYFPDGSILRIEHFIYDMHYYINQKAYKNPIFAVNHFLFRFSPNASIMNNPTAKATVDQAFGTQAWGWDGTYEGAKNGCYNGQKGQCTKLIQLNGWKIPKDYPYKF